MNFDQAQRATMQRCLPCPSQPMWIPSRIGPQRQVIEPCISIGCQKSPTLNCARTSGSLATWHRPGGGRWDTHGFLDALAGKGYVGEACVIEHVPGAPRLVFDNRKPLSKKAYFRCVIAAAKLLAAGVTSFKSNRSTAFYACVLRHSKLPPRGKTTKQMQELVKGTNSEDQPVVQEALNECVPSAAPCRT